MSTLAREAGISKPIQSKSRATDSKFLSNMKANGVYISSNAESNIRSKIINSVLTFSELSDLESDNSNAECTDVTDCQLPEVDLKWMVEKPTEKVFQPSAPILQQYPLPEPRLSRTIRRILFTNLIFHYYLTNGQFKN
jgi:hypothetical protein